MIRRASDPGARALTRLAAATLVVLLGGACARQPAVAPVVTPAPAPRPDLYVLLPDRDGSVGSLTVVRGSDRETLTDAYAAVRVTEDGRLERTRLTEQEMRAVFDGALGVLPPPPASFMLHFTFGTDQLTPESSRALTDMMAEVARRPDPEVLIIGHTDRVGSVAQNDALSLQRAERVREAVLRLGIAADRVQVSGRGEREPLVPTEDEVAEPRNRRVELTVR
jgi:outer membrane protein OmpA-like peptidoglycan-associated protein